MNLRLAVPLAWEASQGVADGRYTASAADVSSAGAHESILVDYEIENVPGFGTLKVDKQETRPEALEASLSDEARITFFEIKNSWGTDSKWTKEELKQAGYTDTDPSHYPDKGSYLPSKPGYNHIELGYLDAAFSDETHFALSFALPPVTRFPIPSTTSCDAGEVGGAIGEKYRALGGCSSVLGAATSTEQQAPDGVGRYTVFEHGSIYWTAKTGAFEVHGAIRDAWGELGWETAQGPLGYPISDEVKTPDGIGRYNVFERGSIYWTPQTGAHEVLGLIRERWGKLGWETSSLGYPLSGEYTTNDGKRQSDFQHGSISWDPKTNALTVTQSE